MMTTIRADRRLSSLQEWLDACRSGRPTRTGFDVGGRLSEFVLAGIVACRIQRLIQWDGPAMRAVNLPHADRFIRSRPGRDETAESGRRLSAEFA
jgi:hypothetical protein